MHETIKDPFRPGALLILSTSGRRNSTYESCKNESCKKGEKDPNFSWIFNRAVVGRVLTKSGATPF